MVVALPAEGSGLTTDRLGTERGHDVHSGGAAPGGGSGDGSHRRRGRWPTAGDLSTIESY